MILRRKIIPAWLAAVLLSLAGLCAAATPAAAEEATWSGTQQPTPAGSSWPIGLGRIGDIEFEAPNRGLLITEGSPPTVAAGLWAYNGVEWHQYASVCGASEKQPDKGGRIAWAGPNEFWTVSDGRPGQANESSGSTSFEREPPLEDNTLCHFAAGQIVGSYAHPAFQADSYQLMHAASCLSPGNCWFAGDPLVEPEIGSFHLHWNGGSLEAEPYVGEPYAVEDMRALEGRLYESVLLNNVSAAEPPAVHLSEGGQAFGAEENAIPLYTGGEPPEALDFLHLSVAGATLWGAAGARPIGGGGATAGQVTVVQRRRGIWSQLIGPGNPPSGTEPKPLPAILPGDPTEEQALLGSEASKADVSAIAAEPETERAWIALSPASGKSSDRRAVLVQVNSEGEVLGEPVVLPSAEEEQAGIGPKGAAARLACPRANDCWLASTGGWLFHLAPKSERTLPKDGSEGEFFKGVITFRPVDQGLPQVTPDAPPPDTSGLNEELFRELSSFEEHKSPPQSLVTLPLLSHVRSHLVHGSTLELRFHLSVKGRVRLIAHRKRRLVAQTAMWTFSAGNRKLLLRLDPQRWPTGLKLQTHALAPLRTVSSVTGPGANIGTETTGMRVLPRNLLQGTETLFR